MKYWIIGFVIALLLVTSVSAINTDAFTLYSSNDDAKTVGAVAVDSSTGGNNGTINLVTTSVNGILNESYEGSNQQGETVNYGSASNLDCTVNGCSAGCWIRHDDDPFQAEMVIGKGISSGNPQSTDWKLQRSGAADNWQLRISTGTVWAVSLSTDTTDIVPGQWQQIIWTWDGTTDADKVKIYINGSVNVTGTSTHAFSDITDTHDLYIIGDDNAGANLELDGRVDECFFVQRELSAADITELYNNSNGYNPFAKEEVINITATTWGLYVDNLYNDTDLSGVTVTFDAGCTNVTDSNGYAQVTNNTAGCGGLSNPESVTIQFNNYFSNASSYSIVANSTANAGMYFGSYNVTSIIRKIDGATLGAALGTWTVNTSGGKTYNECIGTYPCNIYIRNGTTDLTLQYTGAGDYYNKNFNITITGQNKTSGIVSNVYNSEVMVNSKDGNSNFITNKVYMNVSNSTNSFIESCTTSNGSCLFNLIQGINYFFISNPINYTVKNTTLLVDESTETINLIHLVERTFNLTIRDEITNEIINNTNFTIEIIGDSSANNYTTSNGNLLVTLLTPDDYTIRYKGGEYPLRDYYETISKESFFNITLYALTAGNATDTLITVEDTTGDSIEGATVQLLRYYTDCNCYRVVEMGKTGYNGLTYLISQEATGFYKWLVEYDGTTQFISTEPERLIANTVSGQITRTITIDLGSNYYESFIALTDIAKDITYNPLTETLSFTWNDPSSIVTRGCVKAEYTNNARWVTYGQTCASGSTGSVLLTLNNTNTTTYKWSAVVDTSSTFSSHTLDAGWINPTGSSLFGKVAAFSSLFIIVGGAALFSFSAVALVIWISLALIVLIGIQIAGVIAILPFTLQLVTGFTALIIGVSLYLMRR